MFLDSITSVLLFAAFSLQLKAYLNKYPFTQTAMAMLAWLAAMLGCILGIGNTNDAPGLVFYMVMSGVCAIGAAKTCYRILATGEDNEEN